jgi:Ca-activated chloride channel family protein
MSRQLPAVALIPILFLVASASPFQASTPQSTVPASQAAGVTIAGTVVDAALNPLTGVVVTIERDGKAVGKATTAAGGVFRFTNVAPGAYRVRAEHAGFPVLTRDVRVPTGVTAVQLPLVLSRPEDALKDARVDPTRPQAAPVGAPPPPPTPPPPPPATVQAGSGVVVGGVAGAGGAGGRGGGRGAPPQGQMGQVAERQVYRTAYDEPWSGYRYVHSGERYAHVDPNRFQSALNQPLSTFGADVDTASYTNVRRFLTQGQLPPRDAVRVEEFVNYFKFDYDAPRNGQPIAITTEVGDAPWAPGHKLVLVGARARAARPREIEGRNIVLLLDVSGSMAPQERLPLIKTALRMFVDTLRPEDRLAIVTYAGWSGVALPSTPARYRDQILGAIDRLNAEGSTNGGQGLIMAYRVAREAFMPGGVNRVILATDGDFNVGITSQRDLLQLIERERESGVFLSVLGVGSGNLKDATMEMLADRGNGHYAYLDSLQEARRVLVREADATIETVAKDVKFQVEFNPAVVNAWKLIGYENRLLAPEDFNDDRKDGGEMGAGHVVTVLYEIIPVGVAYDGIDRGGPRPEVDPLRYQQPPAPAQPRPVTTGTAQTGEWLTVKARFKAPEGERSDLITVPVRTAAGRVRHLPLAAAVAEFGLLLRGGGYERARWDALAQRVGELEMPASFAADRGESFRELVAIARGLVR